MTHRILHIIPSFDRGGAEKQLALLAAGLPRDEFDVHVCALTRGGPVGEDLADDDIPTTVIGKSWRADPRAYWQLVRHVRRLKPDLVHTWLFAANSYGRLAAAQAGVPHRVAAERCVDRWKMPYHFAIDRLLARRTDRIVVNSTGVLAFYAEHGIPTEKFVLIHNGVAPSKNPNTTRADVLRRLELPDDAHIIAAVGRLWPQKRLEDFIWSIELLRHVDPRARLVVIGDGPLRDRLKRYARRVQVDHLVHFAGHRDDVPELMPHFDVLALTSAYEGMPNSVMEAMAAGVPVVATDVPGTRDLVVAEETGYLVPVGARDVFCQRVRKLLENDELRRQLGDAGRRRVAECFPVEKMVNLHAELYRNLLS